MKNMQECGTRWRALWRVLVAGVALCTAHGCKTAGQPHSGAALVVVDELGTRWLRVRPEVAAQPGTPGAPALWQRAGHTGPGLPVYMRDLGNRGFVRIGNL